MQRTVPRKKAKVQFLVLLPLLALVLALIQTNAYAAPGCDPTYYDALAARAWMEAEREIIQNQTIILKPDSVFQYTCFDKFVGELGTHAKNMFSENLVEFDGELADRATSGEMTNALNDMVMTSLIEYIATNFSFTTLYGGHPDVTGYTPTPFVPGAPITYSCDIMMQVWNAAKCTNFDATFFPFADYAAGTAGDTRGDLCLSVEGDFQDNITVVEATPMDNMDLFSLSASACAGSSAHPTGIEVEPPGSSDRYDEKFCIHPGCYYDPDDNRCKPN